MRDPEAFVVAVAPEDRAGHARVLRGDGWRVWVMARLSHCAERLEWHRPDVVLLDLDGLAESWVGFLTLLDRVRGLAGRVGVVVLATAAGAVSREWEIAALELGADCWLRKPCDPRELLARCRRLAGRGALGGDCRACGGGNGQRSPAGAAGEAGRLPSPCGWRGADVPGVLRLGDALFYPGTGVVRLASRRVDLSPRQRDLLLALARRMGRAVGRELLLGEVWGGGAARTPRVVDSYVALLRRRLARLGPGGPAVETVGGVGYRLVPARGAGEERPLAR